MSNLPSPSDMIDLTGRVIVVTGAAGGIGSGITRRLAQAGASVVAHTRTTPLDELMDELPDVVTPVTVDLTTPDGPAVVVRAAVEHHGRIDGLVNNAGIQPVVPFSDLTDDQWTEMIDTNLTAAHRLTHAVAATMREGGAPGSIVHIASIEGRHPTAVHGHYATSKAALIMHAKAAALAYGPNHIRVNSVSPGLVGRQGLEDAWPDGVKRWLAAAPLARLGTPEDVGDACVFLCSDLARWITGHDLVVDGGVLTHPTW
jgi:NAD(P)-dependent dehydrogenase (short-subunit alcohol dehydrogenase family)